MTRSTCMPPYAGAPAKGTPDSASPGEREPASLSLCGRPDESCPEHSKGKRNWQVLHWLVCSKQEQSRPFLSRAAFVWFALRPESINLPSILGCFLAVSE